MSQPRATSALISMAMLYGGTRSPPTVNYKNKHGAYGSPLSHRPGMESDNPSGTPKPSRDEVKAKRKREKLARKKSRR